MNTRKRRPIRVLSHRMRWKTKSESWSKSPQGRRKTTKAKDITSTPSVFKILPHTKPSNFIVKQVSGFKVPESCHTWVNCVIPCQLAGLNDCIGIGFED